MDKESLEQGKRAKVKAECKERKDFLVKVVKKWIKKIFFGRGCVSEREQVIEHDIFIRRVTPPSTCSGGKAKLWISVMGEMESQESSSATFKVRVHPSLAK
jgi:hypothetical protein